MCVCVFFLHVFTINKKSGVPGSRNASLSFFCMLYIYIIIYIVWRVWAPELPILVGGFKHVLFVHFFNSNGNNYHPTDELHHFSRWLLHHQPDLTRINHYHTSLESAPTMVSCIFSLKPIHWQWLIFLYVIYSLKSLGTWISNGFKPHFPVKNGPKWKHVWSARRRSSSWPERSWSCEWICGSAAMDGPWEHLITSSIESMFAMYLLEDQKRVSWPHTRVYIYIYTQRIHVWNIYLHWPLK